MSTSILGHAVHRSEDPSFLTGAAAYVDDLDVQGALRVLFVRSPVAHARIARLDLSTARSSPGVVGVFAADELSLPPSPAGRRPALARPRLAGDVVRYVGEPFAVIVAESLPAATDAAELVDVDFEPLPVVVDPVAAMAEDAPLLFPDHGANVVSDTSPDALDEDVLAGSEVVVRARFVNQRVAPVPVEGNAALADPRPADGVELTVFASTQAPFGVRREVADALGMEESAIRVVAPAVGGGFGAKGGAYPEVIVLAALARRLGRPVRWAETRSENLVAMTHGRAQVQDVELGARRDGTLVGLRARVVTDVGAYSWRGTFLPGVTRVMASGVYRIPRIAVRPMAVVTNTTPTGPYRGAGRPEAAAMLERAMDMLAAELGLDPVELRRRNFITPDEFPYRSPTGVTYDSGDYGAALDRALSIVGYDAVRRDQAERRSRGDRRLLGIGVSTYAEISGMGGEFGAVSVAADGRVTVTTGTSPHGQGHATTLAQVAASVLRVPFTDVTVVHSDTATVPRGVGTFGSRSGQLGGSAVMRAGEAVVEQARHLAAAALEADPGDIVQTDDGRFGVAGVPARALSWTELVALSAVSEGEPGGAALAAEFDFTQDATFPFGAHVAVVEVDTDTGRVTLQRMVAVDDCGRLINPMIVEGQIHGGLAQGVAQALYEAVAYDPDGNPLTSNLVDYCVPTAPDLPAWETDHTMTPTPNNPLGIKGVGESGTTGSTPAVQNAVVDALSHLGVRHLDMPLTAERVWRAINGAG
ncbi:MAG TPA: xanthine dehydrogenase family protein molybdopterin-binding subunit [Acidimicrobiales bacterium]|nr:xanthine dehydrogenase family protein molybdopterin-binding subunit [Acidimicrobiales bacterium]